MTAQVSDVFTYKRKKYILIDVEMGKQIINCAEFQVPEHVVSICSACWRGYVAKYSVKQGKLYGVRCEWDSDGHREIKSKPVFMNFTGSCVIARVTDREMWRISDFLECYLNYDEAWELHFTDGVLDEERNLENAIAEANRFKESDIYKSETTEPYVRGEHLEQIARMNLKYKYDYRTYKWRNDEPDYMAAHNYSTNNRA